MNIPVSVYRSVTSGAAQVNSAPIYVGGNDFNCQSIGPAALGIVEVSNDGSNWVSAAATLANALTSVTTKPKWARAAVAIDGGAPRVWSFHFVVRKETK